MTDASSSDRPLDGLVALVTGATRGIGRAAALGLARAGAHVIAVGRTQGALEALDDEILEATGERATLVPLDLAQADGIDQLGGAIHQRWGRLDVLVHAAGILGELTPTSHIEPKLWDRVLSVNLTSSYRLIRSLEPLLRKSAAGRAIFLTSGAAVRPRAFWSLYAASKAGLEGLVKSWADEVENTPIRPVLLDPGAMRTAMRAKAFPGEDPQTLPDPAEIAPLVVELARPDLSPAVRVDFKSWKAG
ncbi:MAG: oxidoreductase [Phenylobacterium sp.]|jgi:NAD(P)-dependent dehydrogenase (short-subunit alcohol dehydrogenase family)|nr:oxidoreductase [Phenylobacterium sp.]